jgi:hypothetical protein
LGSGPEPTSNSLVGRKDKGLWHCPWLFSQLFIQVRAALIASSDAVVGPSESLLYKAKSTLISI